ncbi:MAG: 4Fe-4S binding protein [Archaeoglobus sp.]|nr:4Fe-4S binding protein [Archaeoglobus sp.]
MIKIKTPKLKTLESIKLHLDALFTGAKEAIKPGTITIEYPRERRKLPDNFRGYILFSPERCKSCWQCSFVCPANAIKMELASNNRYYPSIDYAKCIFCHFCIDTCPVTALKPTKIHDVVYKDLEEMYTPTELMVKPPKIVREEEVTVEYVMDGDIILKKSKELDELFPEIEPHVEIKEHSVCIDPESCIACGICEHSCPVEAITRETIGQERHLRIDIEKCYGCGICVRSCPMHVLKLVRIREEKA